jgi:hypothetical protein
MKNFKEFITESNSLPKIPGTTVVQTLRNGVVIAFGKFSGKQPDHQALGKSFAKKNDLYFDLHSTGEWSLVSQKEGYTVTYRFAHENENREYKLKIVSNKGDISVAMPLVKQLIKDISK